MKKGSSGTMQRPTKSARQEFVDRTKHNKIPPLLDRAMRNKIPLLPPLQTTGRQATAPTRGTADETPLPDWVGIDVYQGCFHFLSEPRRP